LSRIRRWRDRSIDRSKWGSRFRLISMPPSPRSLLTSIGREWKARSAIDGRGKRQRARAANLTGTRGKPAPRLQLPTCHPEHREVRN